MKLTLEAGEIREALEHLKAGDEVLLNGAVYTARDAAHQQLFELLDTGRPLPFPLQDAILYYAGPTPGQKGMAVGACGPTTAGRMDGFAPRLLRLGVAAMIGKGERNKTVEAAIRETGSCYFCAPGGAGALIARCITCAEEIAFPHLGCESIKRLWVKELPLIVAIDRWGGNLFREGRKRYSA